MKKLLSLILATVILSGCAAAPIAEPAPAISLAEASYPTMAPYPNEADFIDPKTGIFDDEGFSQVYDAWRGNLNLCADIPQGYADSLLPYFQKSIPAFLADEGENTVCSPLNICMALAMLAEITDNDTRKEILTLMGADSIDSLRTQAGRIWQSHYCADGASACVLANSLWLDNGLTYHADTVNRLASDHYASVFQGDLGSEEVNQLLRDWLNQQTSGLLKEQADNLSLDPQTVLALASTIYYRAKWRNEFWPENNEDGFFHSPSGKKTVTYMKETLTYGPYYWGDDFGAVSLGLEDGSRMWLILPDEGKAPADLLTTGHALGLVLGDWLETGAQKSLRVNLKLPKFDAASDRRLDEALKSLGITSAFGHDADFSPILFEQEAWLDAVNHAARVKIDEEGVEAAAYTVMAVAGAARPPEDEMDFILDRPFLFFITSRDNLPLFAGIVYNP